MPECISGLCAQTPNGSVCTRFCGPDRQCSPGFECRRIDAEGTAICIAPAGEEDEPESSGGGCSVGGARTSGLGGVALYALLALGAATRRRRSARRSA
jgi:hypothetical protein